MAKGPAVKFEVRGIEEILQKLRALPAAAQDKVAMNALRVGSRVFEDEMRVQAPLGPSQDIFKRPRDAGGLRASVTSRRERWGSTGITARIWAKAPHAWNVEHGHRAFIGDKYIGRAAPNAFTQRTFDIKADAATEAALVEAERQFEKVLAKMGTK